MCQKKIPSSFAIVLALALVFCLLILFFGDAASGQTQSLSDSYAVDLSNQNLPNGAVFLIVDGLGAYYIFPGLKPESLTGEIGTTAQLKVLPQIYNNGFSSFVKVPYPVTDKGHSVLVTGNPKADPEMVGYSDSTFLDVLRQEGFICIGIMQRGDFESMRKKFDVIIYDKSNSVNNMDFMVQKNDLTSDPQSQRIINEVVSVMESQSQKASSYSSKDTSEKYAAYNRWGLDTACEVLSVMEKYPSQKFVLVINVGATDSTGHYRGYYAYLDSIEQLDRDLEKLFEKCRRNNLLFIFTSDHGMAFEGFDKKSGGHSSTKYSKAKESTTSPFIIYGTNIKKVSLFEANQEDIAPTFLSLFNLNNQLRFSKGNILPAKERVTLTLDFPQHESIYLYSLDSGEEYIFSSEKPYSSYSISGLKTGNYRLKWGQQGSSTYTQTEYIFFIEKDTTIDFSNYLKKSTSPIPIDLKTENSVSSSLFTKLHIFIIIGLINIIGIGGIYKIYKKRR
ncbi:MAG: sulfatase-like hydrolase/transferase [Methanimicrococcus sp.]|nr:sulfatase-like hydrolase/transferase [Methanimicrococcus sp.]